MIRVYDQFGRAVTIGREAWRRDVLLPNLQTNRDNPDALYDLVVSALNDGFATDVLDSARHLAENDPQPQRGAMVLGIVLLQLKDHLGARDVLERAIARHGENAYLLANLARAYAAAGDDARAQALIWRALELEPNEETALNWLINMSARKGRTPCSRPTRARRRCREAGARCCGSRALRSNAATSPRQRVCTRWRWRAPTPRPRTC